MERTAVEQTVKMDGCGVSSIGNGQVSPLTNTGCGKLEGGSRAEVNIPEQERVVLVEAAHPAGEVDTVEQDESAALICTEGDGQVSVIMEE